MPRLAVVGPMMEQRALTAGLALACVAQVALTALKLPGWPCAFRQVTGLPCPGCGLSRALSALLHGQWREAMAAHAFAPVALLGAVALVVAALLPEGARRGLAARVGDWERRTGLALALGAGLIVYWIARLLYTPLAHYPIR